MIHPTAIIDPKAKLAADVKVGPYTVIGPDVVIGEGNDIGSHVVIKGPTTIGKNNKIYQFSSIGEDPQDKKYAEGHTVLEIGDNNVIREFCTLNRGTEQGGNVTRIGHNNLLMATVHVAHDCIIGNYNIIANGVGLAGHIIVDDFVVIGGMSGIHQFCHLGSYSFVAGGSMISQDVLPFVRVSGYIAKPFGLNSVGLKRHNFSAERQAQIKQMYRIIYRSNLTLKEAIEKIKADFPGDEDAARMLVILEKSDRGIAR